MSHPKTIQQCPAAPPWGIPCGHAVFGGDIGARDGTLTIMVGGDASALEKVMPVFQAMGRTVTHVGDP
ncbi:MAG TPA: NAD(P)-binding domain-containing protein [Anaerolineales bacterium]|nr:NAD(P)-binding domain-containing protein [Anaerolineales bacterium]